MNTPKLLETVLDKLEKWLTALVAYLPNLVLAILVFMVFLFFARFVERFSKKQLINVHLDETISRFLSRLIFLGIMVGGLMLALSILNLTGTVTSILAGLGILGLALGFAFQDTAANFMSGIYITFQQPYAIGDVIETHDGIMGNVVDVNLRVTKVKTFDGPMVYVPNRFLFQENFINYTEAGRRRIRIDCGVSYGEDLELVERVALEAVSDVPGKIEGEDVSLFWKGFGDSSIDFSVNIWLEYTRENRAYIVAKNQAIKNIKKAFDEHGITIPFPIRTLDFGIKGGEKFSEQLTNAQVSFRNKSD
ncbi:small conductance mechanosensitive channel [Cyclobacterium xiamenense]|uniref:Small conductance mechanosensitive channel n=1 Tax=Cyclobacterium xiamenense TaxID=1297121 RepID=A0A1H7BBH8_9BACT|nr:mechanosensitive ion channel family protein [Cyclobacterium xiamenense]SEJ73627.1 small conductance mechanosensitive channel [Cyclobacterium xiamenense]